MAYKRQSPQPVVEGGTSLQAITVHNLIVGNGTSAPNLLAPSATAGIAVVSDGNAADPHYSTVVVAGGGTGIVTTTAYAPILAGTTATNPFQQATTNFGTAGYVLTSTGSSSVPTWQAVSANANLTITPVAFGDSPYTVIGTDEFLSVDSTGGAITILLPDAPTTGRVIYIKDATGTAVGASSMTVTTVSGSDFIDGSTSYSINTAYQSISVVFDGANYLVF